MGARSIIILVVFTLISSIILTVALYPSHEGKGVTGLSVGVASAGSDPTVIVSDLQRGVGDCLNINGSMLQNACMRDVSVNTLDLSGCMNISQDSLRDICIRDIALEVRNSGICRLISETTVRDTCYSRIAVSGSDVDLCSLIGNDFIRKSCVINSGGVKDKRQRCEYGAMSEVK